MNLFITLSSIVILTILILPIKNTVYLSICVSLISFTRVLSSYRFLNTSFTLGRFIPGCYIVLDVMMNGIISLSGSLLLLYGNAADFLCVNFVPAIY